MKPPREAGLARPFFHAKSAVVPRRGRLLLISYHFPPAPASGALRWQKLSRFVAEYGWGLDVITLDPSELEAPDYARLADLAPGTRVFGVPAAPLATEHFVGTSWEVLRQIGAKVPRLRSAATAGMARPGSFGRRDVRWAFGSVRGFIRAYGAWLQHASIGRWARDVAKLAFELIDPAVHKATVTSGPPHMAYEAGRIVSRQCGLPFIMDMRDPWSLAERLLEPFASPLWLHLASHYERRSVAQAALVVTNTEPFRLAMREHYPGAAERIITVMNGSDDDPVPHVAPRDRFTIAYAGTIYLDRDPRLLFRAVARVIEELALTPTDLGVEFIGHVEQYGSTPVREIAREERINEFVTIGPPRPHREAMEFLARASLLVSLPQDSDLAIPAKIFEYLRFEAWLLILATHRSATGLLLRNSGADVVAPDDVDGMADAIRKRFRQYREGARARRLPAADRFSRRHQAALLLDAIARCTEQRSSPAAAAIGSASSSMTAPGTRDSVHRRG